MNKTIYIDKIAKWAIIGGFSSLVIAFSYGVFVNRLAFNKVESATDKIYVLANGNSLELALSQDATVNRSAEAKNHLKMFHSFFYNLDPDPKDIEKSIERALYLGDNSVRSIYVNRKENLYYEKLVDGATSSRALIDSIQLDLSNTPYRALIFGRQKLIRPFSVVEKSLIASCQLRSVKRTDNNPHGLFIERYKLLKTDIINEYKR